jgi:CRP/FNR family transcriptional regulator, cyclic AMP receptor protein
LIKLLSIVDVLEPLGTEEIDWIAQRGSERSFERDEIVYVPGTASEVVFLLLAGRIRLYGVVGGQEVTFDILQSGTTFGVASMLERFHEEYAVALEPSRVGLLNLNTFWHLTRQNHEVSMRLVKLLGEHLRLSRSRMRDIALKEVPARLASLILTLVESEGVVTREGHYKILTRYTQEQLATMIGAKRVAVTRAFGILQDIGGVQLRNRQIIVIDLAALRSLGVEG